MQSRKPWLPSKWGADVLWAMGLLLVGLVIVLFVAVTEGEYGVWTLWIAIPLLMFSLAYLFLVNAVPIFLRKAEDDEPEQEQPEGQSKE